MPESQNTHAGHDHAAMPADEVAQVGGATAIDPVCGMTVNLKADTRTESFDGKPFHFCSEKCQTKFKGDPWFYASGNAAKRGKVVAVGTKYTCPMHP
ncbi:MAG: YHS domain-containing protein, partial [Cypionkella sp.]|nr:YHS domain-containing protein [Cypionkella sp.]